MVNDLLAFFADRLKVYLKDQGARHDLIDAVFSLGGQDDLLMIVRRVEALSKFLDSDDGKNLLAGVKRASNILKIEEKKDNRSFDGLPNPQLLIQGEERDLHRAVSAAEANARKAVENEDFGAAMTGNRQIARPRRCLLRQGDGERRRSLLPRKPPEALEPHPRGDAGGGGFFED